MDPDQTLAALRAELHKTEPDIARAAELFHALDHWMTSGGFLPTDWTKYAR